jgi:hypothetical protein
MPADQVLLDGLRPTAPRLIYDCAVDLGLDLRPWLFDRHGNKIDPSDSTFQNSQWVYGGGTKPYAACIWWAELKLEAGQIVREANLREVVSLWETRKIDERHDPSVGRHLTPKIRKARDFDAALSASYRTGAAMRVILLDGNRANAEQAAYDSSSARYRLLDSVNWYVHLYDVESGNFRLVRDVPPPPRAIPDPFDDAPDPGMDPEFQALLEIGDLTDTEKDALIKVRVGQGWFRDKLIERWNGCSVSEVRSHALLIASHIKPWSRCAYRLERLSPDNGLLLTPNLDKLFDRGLIAFDQRSKMVISKELGFHEQGLFGINQNSKLRMRFDDMRPYLEWHHQNVFEHWLHPKNVDDASSTVIGTMS